MVDVFEEVEDQLRTEQYKRLAIKVLPWLIGALVLALVAFGGWFGWKAYNDSQTTKASVAYQAAVESFSGGDLDGSYARFGEVVKMRAAGYKSLALMVQGGIRMEQKRYADAAALFDAAAKAAPGGAAGRLLSDSARLKSALAMMDDAPYADIEGRLKPLTEKDRPYRAIALETLAFAKINAGKVKEARADFESLTTALDASPELIERAKVAVSMIDSGAAAAIPAVVKASKTMAPPAPMPAPAAPAAPAQVGATQ